MAHIVPTVHTVRNLPPILEVLRIELRGVRTVLEIGSGNGQHATGITADMDSLRWQTSDRRENHDVIRAWLAQERSPRVLPPLALDVLTDPWPERTYDAVFSANTAHIMGLDAVENMFALSAGLIAGGGKFCLYGPFGLKGRFNSASNVAFDRSLKERSPEMGIRQLEDLDSFAERGGLHRAGLYTMPANNYLAVWQKQRGEPDGDA